MVSDYHYLIADPTILLGSLCIHAGHGQDEHPPKRAHLLALPRPREVPVCLVHPVREPGELGAEPLGILRACPGLIGLRLGKLQLPDSDTRSSLSAARNASSCLSEATKPLGSHEGVERGLEPVGGAVEHGLQPVGGGEREM